MTSKYMKDADGIYHCEVTKFEKKGDFPVTKEKGYKFTFKLDVKDKAVVLSDLTGDDIGEDAEEGGRGRVREGGRGLRPGLCPSSEIHVDSCDLSSAPKGWDHTARV